MKKVFAIVLVIAIALSMCACAASKGPTSNTTVTTGAIAREKTFTVTVVHGNNTEKVFNYATQEEKLGGYLEAQGLIESQGADAGMFHTVDGEKTDWNENQSYWALYIDGEYAMKGIYDTEITDGAAYRLVYTLG